MVKHTKKPKQTVEDESGFERELVKLVLERSPDGVRVIDAMVFMANNLPSQIKEVQRESLLTELGLLVTLCESNGDENGSFMMYLLKRSLKRGAPRLVQN